METLDRPDPTGQAAAPDRPVRLIDIAMLHAKLGLSAFGGGMSGLVFHEVVTRRGWMNEREFLSGLAVCQIIPGVNIGNLAIYVGQRLRGWPGSLVALSALLFGPFFVVIGAAMAYDWLRQIGAITAGLAGVTAAAIGLLLVVVIRGTSQVSRQVGSLAVIAGTAWAVGVMRWPLIPVVLVVVPCSIAMAAWRRRADG
ncbi:chromate transporter [Ancylobacter sp. MQZ15Z-1]|uniref:Chromate transporter n=1 Tax=Ancylobacter mangrovi TaxID=2972472 RepID=A0A9X2PJF9_9HYPH|nr:chromate transporter [Ancylobacter mangrovi]MCS0497190.1 chromate transporter [Ancylobacter mangrovi]